ncbi:unnamed protein product [Lathyrus oleraceus]
MKLHASSPLPLPRPNEIETSLNLIHPSYGDATLTGDRRERSEASVLNAQSNDSSISFYFCYGPPTRLAISYGVIVLQIAKLGMVWWRKKIGRRRWRMTVGRLRARRISDGYDFEREEEDSKKKFPPYSMVSLRIYSILNFASCCVLILSSPF